MNNRRAFLRGASVLMGSAALGQVIAAFAAAPRKASTFTDSEMGALRALVDVILPETDSPAASAADTHYFIDLALPACGTQKTQATFRAGLADFADFDKLAKAEQVSKLKAHAVKDVELPYEESFFLILKDYTLTGYFLSETGATKALAYERVPGGFQGDLLLRPDQKAWAI